MCVISARLLKTRKDRKCTCGKWIEKGQKYVRLFGMAHWGEKPYEIFNCIKCIIECESKDKPILKVKKLMSNNIVTEV